MVKNKVCRNAAKAVACDEQQPLLVSMPARAEKPIRAAEAERLKRAGLKGLMT